MIKVTNNLSGKEEIFKSRVPNKVDLYVCGVTPYDYSHLGHGRCYVSFDLLYRVLTFLGYDVTYCRNYTDIDDKIIKKAEQEFGDKQRYADITKKYIAHYQDDMKALNCVVPDHEPRVTENIDDIITFISGLIEKGKAYEADGDVYFSIKSFPEYGKFSKHDVKDLRVGQRVEPNSKKRDPLDFALWKSELEGQFWQSPWGWGRPGWHIECSVLASKYLGTQIDIHAGGMDLIFPHHENEIAQSEALHGKPFANYWMHNGFVQINKEKMSKSLGNFFTLQEIFKKYDPMVVRFYFLNHQYRAPLDFSFDDLDAFQKSYQKLCRVFEKECSQLTNEEIKKSPTVQKMLAFLQDDLNTPGMMGVVFESLRELEKNESERCAVKAFIQKVLGLNLQSLPEKEIEVTEQMKRLIAERETARAEKNWTRADEIRDKLVELGYKIQDKKL